MRPRASDVRPRARLDSHGAGRAVHRVLPGFGRARRRHAAPSPRRPDMSAPLKTSVTELEESRVRVEVEVDADDFQKGIDRTARGLAGEMKVPGFRKGKVPPQMVVQRVGREALVE